MHPGQKYIPSSKYNFLRVNFILIVGFFIAIYIGRLYAFLAMYNPISLLHFFVLFGLIVVMSAFYSILIESGKTENKLVNKSIIILLIIVAWLAHWAQLNCSFYNEVLLKPGEEKLDFWSALFNINDIPSFITFFSKKRASLINGSGILSINYFSPGTLRFFYFIEAIIFCAPLVFSVGDKMYYCKDCKKKYTKLKGFAAIGFLVNSKAAKIKIGDFSFLDDVHFFKNPTDAKPHLDPSGTLCCISIHYCEYCNDTAIININEGQAVKKSYGERFLEKKFIVEDIFIDAESKGMFKMKL
jgi:hypothetical protein